MESVDRGDCHLRGLKEAPEDADVAGDIGGVGVEDEVVPLSSPEQAPRHSPQHSHRVDRPRLLHVEGEYVHTGINSMSACIKP